MGLSSILDIAIGLIFIYLIVSLLASEIQELIATILQWRAVHIKESIEGLLSGNSDDENDLSMARELANKVYENHLIKDLTFEARRGIASIVRLLLTGKGFSNFFSNGVFGTGNSGPAYISKEVFANSLFETLKFPAFTKILIKLKLDYYLDEDEKGYKNFLSNDNFKNGKYLLYSDFDNGKISLKNVLDGLKNLTALEPPVGTDELIPSLVDIVQIFAILNNLDISKKLEEIQKSSGNLLESIDTYLSKEFSGSKLVKYKFLKVYIEKYLQNDPGIDDEVFKVIAELPKLPEPLKNSLNDLAKQSQAKVEKLENQLTHFQQDVEHWFDQSMDRASGVYKRNARLVAFLIGLTIAFLGNVDTFHVVDRLAKDQSLRDSINRTANGIVAQDVAAKKLDQAKIDKLNAEAEKISLPIGWGDLDVSQQQKQSIKWINNIEIPSTLVTLFGWIISGIAISMGSSFWFDLLGKVINVKNVGKIPDSPSSSSSGSNLRGSTAGSNSKPPEQ